jgi:hypothetical protein
MKRSTIGALLLCWFFIYVPALLYAQVTKDDYLRVIKEANAKIWQIYETSLESWQKSDPALREDQPPTPNIHWGRLDGLLYVVTGERKYAENARKVLLESPYYDNYYAILILKQIEKSGVLTSEDLKSVDKKILEKAEQEVQSWPEWGTMNHCSDIVNTLTAVMQRFPQHPDFARWKQKRDVNLSANIGLWSIEDSHNYIPPWLKPIMQTAELEDWEKEYYALPTTRYYFDYSVQLVRPDGQVAEFGDGGSGGEYTWPWYVSMLEKGASVYHDVRMKWAAHQIFNVNIRGRGQAYIYAMKDLVEAYLWADDSLPEEIPTDKSRLVLEDYVGKKVVFRSGWDANATYLFLNFLEDAPFGIDGKEHIINTINVESEKNHHGHADENAICLLMKDGAVLLHDSGYREIFGTGTVGEYRADTYHNKLIVRPGLADRQTRLMPFLLDEGRCRQTETKLMHFRRFKEVDVSRTRLTDRDRGYQWDRVISYLKGKEWFVIFDIVKILKDGPYTLANLFYTQDIVDYDQQDRCWFDTRYRTIATTLQSGGFAGVSASELLNPSNTHFFNPNSARLLMYFPEGVSFRRGVEAIRRSYQTENAVYTAKADTLKAGEILVFTTLLIPHSKTVLPKALMSSLADMAIYHSGNGYGIRIPTEDGFIQLNAMLDLEAEYLQENIRPRYNFESGRAEYGSLTTDARFCYLNRRKDFLFYSFFSASKLIFDGKTIFEAQGQPIGQDDGSFQRWGVPKWVAWEDTVRIARK